MGRRDSGSFLKGALLGAAAGAAAGVLFAPKSGKETREDIKEKAQNMKSQAEDMYNNAKKSLDRKMEEVKKLGDKIDKSRYETLVGEVVDEMKNNKEVTAEAGRKLGQQLKADWEKVKESLKA